MSDIIHRARQARARAKKQPNPDSNGRAAGHDADRRRPITITTQEHDVNDTAVAAIATDPELYQRGGLIVRVVQSANETISPIRRSGGPRIEPLQPATLREALTRVAAFTKKRETTEGVVEVAAHPPSWCVNAVHGRSTWPNMRTLDAVIEYPVLTPKGEILATAGYDESTGLFLAPAGAIESIPSTPTAADIKAATGVLTDVVCDFPFESDNHRAAAFAALLTPLARFAFSGPSPLFLVDANVRGSGKTLLTDVISRIITGSPMVVSTFTSDGDELRKRITAHALAGDRLVLLDNLSGFIKSPVLDAALTSEHWRDRILGVNKTVDVPLIATWFATGNNCQLYSDTARRTCLVRLEAPQENPERRSGFRHPDLLKYVSANRPKLLSAALTILAGYCAAGKPDQNLPAWGSFTGWSDLVRGCVVWMGLPDPGETRMTIADNDPTTEALGLLMAAWEQADPHRHGFTAGEFIEKVRDPKATIEEWMADARAALEILLDRMDARALGNRLRTYRRRMVNDRFFDRAGERQNSVKWAVYPACEFAIVKRKANDTHDTNATPGDSGESGECATGQGDIRTNGFVADDLTDSERSFLDEWDKDGRH